MEKMDTVAKTLVQRQDGAFLVLYRSDTHRRYGGQPDLPGGLAEGGETPTLAAARELQEEAGIAVDPGALREVTIARYPNAVYLLCHAVIEGDEPAITLSREHKNYAWLTRKRLLEIPLDGLDYYMQDVIKYLRGLGRAALTGPA